jgi:hypothetical protein
VPPAGTSCSGNSSHNLSRDSRSLVCTGIAGWSSGNNWPPPPGLLKKEGQGQSPSRTVSQHTPGHDMEMPPSPVLHPGSSVPNDEVHRCLLIKRPRKDNQNPSL